MSKPISSRSLVAITCLCTLLAYAAPAAAQDWEFTLSPYIWAVAMNGDLTVRGNKIDADASFKDILDASDSLLAFNSDIAIRKGKVGLMLSPNYFKLGVDDAASGTPLEADVTTEMLFVDAALSYRVVDWSLAWSGAEQSRSVIVDAYGGVRYTNLKVELDFDDAGSPDGEKDWWDPIIGADSTVPLSPNWFVSFRGDFGGFGAGSDFTANGAASLGYRFKVFGHQMAVRAGYRALFQDYDEDSGADRFEWDTTMHGPTLGLISYWG